MMVKLNGNDFYRVTADFGAIDSVHKVSHNGLDLAMGIGTHLNSPVDGVVKDIVDFGTKNIGKGILIETDDHQTVIMGHLSDVKTHIGARVHEGDFVALSGNTGFSTGGHLHLGLKDVKGQFINPDKLVSVDKSGLTGMVGLDDKWQNFVKQVNHTDGSGGVFDAPKGMWDFIQEWRKDGFWQAMYHKPFFEVLKDFMGELFHDIGIFIVQNGDIFFLLPAILFMGGTWIAGRNKFTKFIIPLWIAFLISKFLYYVLTN